MPSKEIARTIYEESNPRAIFARLLRSRSDDVVLRTVSFLHEQAFGKAKQAIDVSGGIVHAHTVYRDPRLAALSPEELQALDALTKKLALPAPEEAKSEPAIEAEIVEQVTTAADEEDSR